MQTPTIRRLLCFDWDGVGAFTEAVSIEIMIQALQKVIFQSCDLLLNEEEQRALFNKAFQKASGTTEKNFVIELVSLLNDNYHINIQPEGFLASFISAREAAIRRYTESRKLIHLDDLTLFADFVELIKRIRPRIESGQDLVYLTTGNPLQVMDVRLPDSIRPYIHGWATGESGLNKGDLAEVAVRDAKFLYGFDPLIRDGSYKNVFVFDDSPKAAPSILAEGFRMVLVHGKPEGRKQTIVSQLSYEETEPRGYVAKIYNAQAVLTNRSSDFIGICNDRLEQWRAEVLTVRQVLRENGLTEAQIDIFLNGKRQGNYIKRTPQLHVTDGLNYHMASIDPTMLDYRDRNRKQDEPMGELLYHEKKTFNLWTFLQPEFHSPKRMGRGSLESLLSLSVER